MSILVGTFKLFIVFNLRSGWLFIIQSHLLEVCANMRSFTDNEIHCYCF